MCFIADEIENGKRIMDFYLFISQIMCCIFLDFVARDRHTLSGIFKINFYRLCG